MARVNPVERNDPHDEDRLMTTLAVILLVIGIALLLVGVFVEAAKILLWIGLVIVIVAVIAWLMRIVRRNA